MMLVQGQWAAAGPASSGEVVIAPKGPLSPWSASSGITEHQHEAPTA